MSMALHVSGTQILDENNKVVILNGIGRMGFAPNGCWGKSGEPVASWAMQWQPLDDNLRQRMDETFKCYRDVWHVNMVRIFVYPSWVLRDFVKPSEESSWYAQQTTPISTLAYLKMVATEAAKYGIYVSIVPYTLVPAKGSFDLDKYASENQNSGIPFALDEYALGYVEEWTSEAEMWRIFWRLMGLEFVWYPNVIFEAWNEPNDGKGTNEVPSTYLDYLKIMYNSVREVGATNLIVMQWNMGHYPNGWGLNLSHCKQMQNTLGQTTNLVYSTHFYRFAPFDLSQYWDVQTDLKGWVKSLIDSMGVVAPLVMNEGGSCLSVVPSDKLESEYTWWQGVCDACLSNGVGVSLYYWMSDADIGGVYLGEQMCTGAWESGKASPTPNRLGEIFIAHNAQTTLPVSGGELAMVEVYIGTNGIVEKAEAFEVDKYSLDWGKVNTSMAATGSIVVKNTGNVALDITTIAVDLPLGMTFLPSSKVVAVGASEVLDFKLVVDKTAAIGEFAFKIKVTGMGTSL